MTHTTNVTIHLDGADEITVHDGEFPVLQIGTALTMHLDEAPAETLLAVAAALTELATTRLTDLDVADQVAAEDGFRFVGVPYVRPVAA